MKIGLAIVMTAVLAALLSDPTIAQTTNPPMTSAAVTTAPSRRGYGTIASHWVASGFVGTTYGGSTTGSGVDLGGQFAFLWKGVFGAEALTDFARSIKIDDPALADRPHANSYMANLVFALPLGGHGQIQPYLSGGVGGIQLKTAIVNAAFPHPPGAPPPGATDADQTKAASNLGGGVMVFGGMLGVRSEVRYYKASSTSTFDSSSAGQVTRALLSDLSFWRASIGVAVQF